MTRAREFRTAAALGLVFLLFYAGFTHARFKGTDETGVYLMTESLYERGTLEIPPHRHAHVGADGRLRSPFAVGHALAALPLYALGKLAQGVLPADWARALAGPPRAIVRPLPPDRLESLAEALPPDAPPTETTVYGGTVPISAVGLYAPLVAALLAAGLFALLRRLGATPRAALATTFLIGVCSYPAAHAVYFLGHLSELTAVVFALLGFHAYRESGRLAPLALGSACASAIFLLRFPGVLAGPALALYLAHCLHERRRRAPRPGLPDLAALALPFAAAAAVHLAFNRAQWGTLLASPMVAGGLERNDAFATALAAYLVAPGISVFAYSPLLLLLPWTLRAARARWPWECAAIGVYAATQLLFFAGYRYWTGLWSAPGPRYLLPGGALLLLTLAPWLEGARSRAARAALETLAILGALVQLALLCADWQQVTRPLHAAVWQAAQRSGDPERYEPDFAFLFEPAASPILGSLRAAAAGAIDLWLWKLAAGWPGQPARPGLATTLAAAWLLGCAAGARALWRRVRDAP